MPGKAPAVHLGENLPKAKLSQGQPALVPRAFVLGPGLERRHFLHRGSSHCHLLYLRQALAFLTCEKGVDVLVQNKNWICSPEPAPWKMEEKMRWAHPSWYLHSETILPDVERRHKNYLSLYLSQRCCPIKCRLKEQVVLYCLTL